MSACAHSGLPFFSSPERVEHLRTVAESWRFTPFHAHGRVKGPRGGCSCQSLAADIGRECGWLPPAIALPRVSLKHWATHNQSVIVPFIEQHLSSFLMELPSPHPMGRGAGGEVSAFSPGDVVCLMNVGAEHLVTMLDARIFIHSLLPAGVSFNCIDDASFKMHIARAWRPLEL